MIAERQQAVETLTEDHARSLLLSDSAHSRRLTEECSQLQNRVQKYKARVRALESDAATHKQQLRVLVEKTESDDILVEALQEEIQSLRQQNEEHRRKILTQQQQLSQSTMVRTMRLNEATGGMVQVDSSREASEGEMLRLKRLCKQQAAQLETQENLIQQLRAVVPKTKTSSIESLTSKR
jgi:chromosome segregation ATPase